MIARPMNKMRASDSSAGSFDKDFRDARNTRSQCAVSTACKWMDRLARWFPATRIQASSGSTIGPAHRCRIPSPSEVRARYPKNWVSPEKGWPSHEIAARVQLSWYAEVEFQNSITHAADEALLARGQLDRLRAHEKAFAECLRLNPTDMEVRSRLEQVLTDMAKVTAQLRASRPSEGGRPAQNWKAWFVYRVAGFWHIITGEQPSTSPDGPFAKLVAAAWNSFNPKIPEVDWDSFVGRFAKSGSLEEALETAGIANACARRLWQP